MVRRANDKTALLGGGGDGEHAEMGVGVREDTLTWFTKIIYGTSAHRSDRINKSTKK